MGVSRDVLYRSPRQVFEAFKACPRLVRAGVEHLWEDIETKPNRLGPKAIWQTRTFQNGPPRQPRYSLSVADPKTGQKRDFTAVAKHDCVITAEVALFADINGKLDGWGLFELYTLACADVLRIEADYSFGGSVVPREAVSTATEQNRATLTFRIPILDLQPHAALLDDDVSLQ